MRKVIKPWGMEEIWAETKDYVGKTLYIKEGNRLSLQFHMEKEETIRVLEGVLELTYSKGSECEMKIEKLEKGDVFHVRPMTIHRFSATLGTDVTLVEVSTNHLKDVVRLADDYDR